MLMDRIEIVSKNENGIISLMGVSMDLFERAFVITHM